MASHNITSRYQTPTEGSWIQYDLRGFGYPPTSGSHLAFHSVIGKRDVKTDSSNGSWPANKGLSNCTNPYYRFVANWDSGKGSGDYSYNYKPSSGFERFCRGTFLVPFSDFLAGGPSAQVLEPARIAAKLGILMKYQNEVQSFQGGVAFGELRQTLSMLRSPAKALRASIQPYRLRQRRWVNGRQTREVKAAIADTYLEWTFGVMPLIHDIKGALQAIARLNDQPTVKKLAFKAPYTDFFEITPSTPCYKAYADGRNDVRVKIMVKQKGGVRIVGSFVVDVGANPGRNLGMDLNSFVPTAWELLPYSFLADYFSNIGDVLTAGAIASARIPWLSQSEKIESEFRASVVSTSPGLSVTPRGFEGPKQVYLQRSIPSLAVSASDLRVEMPSFDDNAKQWLNIAALLEARRADHSFFHSSRR